MIEVLTAKDKLLGRNTHVYKKMCGNVLVFGVNLHLM
jgi:hypothetical protein